MNLFFVLIRRQPTSTLFPYTTLFRSFNNAGTVRKRIGTGTSTISMPLNNSGTVDVQSGTLSIDRKSTRLNSSHTVNAYVVSCEADNTFNVGSTVTGAGVHRWTGGIVT